MYTLFIKDKPLNRNEYLEYTKLSILLIILYFEYIKDSLLTNWLV